MDLSKTPQKIRIAFFAEILIRDFDGATRTMFQIIDRIDTRRFEFLFFCGVAPPDDFSHEVFEVPAVTLPFNKSYKMASMVGMGSKILNRIREFNPDIIHIATPSPLGYYGLKCARNLRIPVITIYHTHFISYIKYYTRNTPLVTQALEQAIVMHNKSFYDKCDLVYVPTEEMISELSRHDFRTDQMKLWKRGIDLELFHPSKRDAGFIRNIVGNDNATILFASRLVWEKNLNTLIEVYKELQEKSLPFNMVIAGSGVAREELEKKMPNAHFLGHLSHDILAKLYASSDFFIFPSPTETYGNVVAEAMASGLVCVVADGGGVRSFVKQGINGILCSPNHSSEYVKAFEILLHQPDLKRSLQSTALRNVSHLKWDELVQQYFEDLDFLSKLPKSSPLDRSGFTDPIAV